MGAIKRHQPVKLIAGLIFKEDAILAKAEKSLQRKFGKIDFESQTLPFTHTDYYEKELGQCLKRKFIAFKKLTAPEDLAKIKISANKIENTLSFRGQRRINIDPGYLSFSKLVLASTKDYKHRIYLNKGIYAEITLFYQGKSFEPWEWTYRDYQSNDYILIFNRIRQIYAEQLKKIQ